MKQYTIMTHALTQQKSLMDLLGSLLHNSIQAHMACEIDVSFKLMVKARILQNYISGQRIVDDEETILNEILSELP